MWTAEQRLRRSVLSCMLWESEFYEDGAEIAERIRTHTRLLLRRTLAEKRFANLQVGCCFK